MSNHRYHATQEQDDEQQEYISRHVERSERVKIERGITKFNENVIELTADSPMAVQPDKIKLPMYKHQLTALHKIISIENKEQQTTKLPNVLIIPNLVIIADKAGSGKSLLALSVIANNPCLDPTESESKNNIRDVVTIITSHPSKEFIGQNLIIVPHHVCNQWVTYITTQTDLVCSFITSSAELNVPMKKTSDLILVKLTLLDKFIEQYKLENYQLSRVFIDEIDKLQLPKELFEKVSSVMWYYISASSENLFIKSKGVRNSYKQIVKLREVEHENTVLGGMVVKNSNEFIEVSLGLPTIITTTIRCLNRAAINILTGIIDEIAMDMMLADDINSVYQRYGFKPETEKSVVGVVAKHLLDQLRELENDMTHRTNHTYVSETYKKEALQTTEEKIKAVKEKIRLMEERITKEKGCLICYEEKSEKRVITKCCSRSYCFQCLVTWLNTKSVCPNCKKAIKNVNTDVIPIDNEIKIMKDTTGKDAKGKAPANQSPKIERNKIETLIELIKKIKRENPNFRLIIASNYDDNLKLFERELKGLEIDIKELKGTPTALEARMRQFTTGEVRCLLLYTKNYGQGLNLEQCTDMVLYHKINPIMLGQVIGRAQRPGRTTGLKIWNLKYVSEIREGEQWVLI